MRAMAKIRVKVVGSGTPEDPFRVDLPTYMMIPGSEEFDKKDPKRLVSVTVDIPGDECDVHGRPSPKKIRRKYKEQPRWDRPDVAKDLTPPGAPEMVVVTPGLEPEAEEPEAMKPESLWSKLRKRLKL